VSFLRSNKALVILIVVTLLLTCIPVVHAFLFIGDTWQGVPQSYGDEFLYQVQMQTIAEGYFNLGNPYIYEHRFDPPLVLFGGSWIAAIPMLLGLPLIPALLLNYSLWSVIFALLCYWLFREFNLGKTAAALGALAGVLSCIDALWRTNSLQQVNPFFIFFLVALARFLKYQDRGSIILLGIATGCTFWVFSYLWQTAVITLGLLFLWALARKQWALLKATLLSSALGGVIGLPPILYILWQTRAPFFWESIARFGLVDTHLPMAEVVYSGGWIGILLVLLTVLYWRFSTLRTREYALILTFIAVSGLGLWIMQGSNLVTGKLLETGAHLRRFIVPWFALMTFLSGYLLWHHRLAMSRRAKAAALCVVVVLIGANLHFYSLYFVRYAFFNINPDLWQTQQLYAAPAAWLQEHEKEPVVVWGQGDGINSYLPNLSKHYVLYSGAAMFTLIPNNELHERFLVSNYFDDLTTADLKARLVEYVGRGDAYHHTKTVERGVKICRAVFFFDKARDCGDTPTSVELLGEAFFAALDKKYREEIRPNIKTYLEKYHVSYILTDKHAPKQWNPLEIGARLVWSDGRFELYRL
jgi:hypothetical protein